LHVSPKQRLIFQEFVEGKTVAETVKSMLSSRGEAEEQLDLIRDVGKHVAKTHQLSVSLGDCKPENIIVEKNGELCFVDLEQASRDGDQPWDVAEFLYYSGHYVQALAPTDKIEHLAKAFIEGYLEAGGKKETIKKAASPRYTKVFTIFTQPHVILAVSNICRRVK
jgi:tRNA A-37 threonylcarbamoyl transferase component Bud32